MNRQVTHKWASFRCGIAALMIQRKFVSYQLKKLFWAMKTINNFLKSRYFLRLLVQRKKREESRHAAEQETINILIRRANSCMEDMMNADRGDVILLQYLNSVKTVLAQVQNATPGSLLASAKVFPDLKDAPEFARLWTVRAKAMEVLKRRCIYTVTYSARTRFRFTYPPPYACEHCAEPFLMKSLFSLHRKRGCGVDTQKFVKKKAGWKAGVAHRRAAAAGQQAAKSFGEAMLSLKMSLSSPDKSYVNGKKVLSYNERNQEGEGEDEDTNQDDEVPIQQEPSYVCWTLAEPIVSAALRPIAEYLIVPQIPQAQKQQQYYNRPEYDSDNSNDETMVDDTNSKD